MLVIGFSIVQFCRVVKMFKPIEILARFALGQASR